MTWPADRITQSSKKSFGMYEQAAGLMQQGIDLIHLEVGRPSFDTPEHIKQAAKQALDDGHVHYGEFAGELIFRQALVQKLSDYNNISVSPDEVIVVNGLTHGAYAACMAALNPGDEVILLDPHYPQHINKIELAGAIPVFAPLDKANDFRIDSAAIESKITDRTRMIVLVNPANPTGRVFTLDELQGVASLAIKHDLLVMSDEVYDMILYDDQKQHISIASLSGMKERTISLFAFTKAYAMDGWRLGYIATDASMIEAILKMTMNEVAHVNVFIQHGGHAAVTGSQECVKQMVDEDKRRRDLMVQRLNAMPNVSCKSPEGTIYTFPKISATGLSSNQLAEKILHECSVVVESGSFYGATGEGHLRLCFGAESYERIELAMDKLDAFFQTLN
jgi:aspartate aminotransferase